MKFFCSPNLDSLVLAWRISTGAIEYAGPEHIYAGVDYTHGYAVSKPSVSLSHQAS